ncbi:single-stranded DNA-binding protein, partial [Bilophila wadsworthia]|nr:single-stranded DNA-binding protein [Bilophila wadsworthia]
KYQDQQGQDRYVTEIQGQRVQFLDRKGEGDGQQGRQGGGRQAQGRHSADYEDLGPAFPSEASGLDDVPF